MDTTVIVLIIIVVLLVIGLVAAGVVLSRRRRSDGLQDRFGPEYERSVTETGDRRSAEAELTAREKRVRDLDIRSLRPEEREHFEATWDGIQRTFVDDPVRAVHDSDSLVVEIMRTRGYPVDDFDRRAEDLSVDHPDVVHKYREARSVRDATSNGTVDTEQQRHAVTSYRSLVESLLGGSSRGRDDHQAGHRTNDAPTTEERTR